MLINYGNKCMKKTNNKYRGNNNNNYSQIYSLNYKFDSCSAAGKCSGTALDLIKRYNELAKEALGNGNYVEAEGFRQYAEHYRKIVTDINEKKMQNQAQFQRQNEARENEAAANSENVVSESTAEVVATPAPVENVAEVVAKAVEIKAPQKREFKVIEISHAEAKSDLIANTEAVAKVVKAPRAPRRKPVPEAVQA